MKVTINKQYKLQIIHLSSYIDVTCTLAYTVVV
jgi:hypothetical protein